MPAEAEQFGPLGRRDRAVAVVITVAVQTAVGLALLSGLRVDLTKTRDVVQRLIEIGLPPPPPVVQPLTRPERRPAERSVSPAPKAAPAPPGGSPGPVPAHAPPSVAPVVAIRPSAPPSGGGSGLGPALGSGSGGGSGGQGYGGEDGGTDLELISGEIRPSDYPRHLGNAGVGGRVSVTFVVQVNGRPSGCRVTRSSGIYELDALTCRLIEKRFRFRPSLDRFGRPVPDQVDWDHDWIAGD